VQLLEVLVGEEQVIQHIQLELELQELQILAVVGVVAAAVQVVVLWAVLVDQELSLFAGKIHHQMPILQSSRHLERGLRLLEQHQWNIS